MSFHTLVITDTSEAGEHRYRCELCGEESGWLATDAVFGHSCRMEVMNRDPVVARMQERRAERKAAGVQPPVTRCLESLVSDANLLLRMALRKEGLTAKFTAQIQRQLDAAPSAADIAEEVKRRADKGLPI